MLGKAVEVLVVRLMEERGMRILAFSADSQRLLAAVVSPSTYCMDFRML